MKSALLALALAQYLGFQGTGALQGPALTYVGGMIQVTGASTTATVTTSASIPAGAVVVAVAANTVDTTYTCSVTSPNLTFTQRHQTANAEIVSVWTAVAGSTIASGEVITNTLGATNRHPGLAVWVVTGVNSGILTQVPSGNQGGNSTAAAATASASGTAFFIGGVSSSSNAAGISAGTGATQDGYYPDGTNQLQFWAGHRTAMASGSNALNATLTTSGFWSATVIAIQ